MGAPIISTRQMQSFFAQLCYREYILEKQFHNLDSLRMSLLNCIFKPVHWFQFADDATVVATNERENQLLLNCFTKWCQWSSYMIIRVDKCLTFGIKKFSSRSLQYEPNVFVNNKTVPAVKSGESFKYLGRYFNFEMDNKAHKEILQSSLFDLIAFQFYQKYITPLPAVYTVKTLRASHSCHY